MRYMDDESKMDKAAQAQTWLKAARCNVNATPTVLINGLKFAGPRNPTIIKKDRPRYWPRRTQQTTGLEMAYV